MSQVPSIPDLAPAKTWLAARLSTENRSAPELKAYRGARTPLRFSDATTELRGLLQGAGIFDLGYRAFLRATGKDRVRWLNGMVTQAVKLMTPGQVAYTLVLNPQGRIQGDADIYCHEEFLGLETDFSQADRLLTHLHRFIIMDDVKLEGSDAKQTAIGICGPNAAALLEHAGAAVPEPGNFRTARISGVDVMVAYAYSPLVPRFEIHTSEEQASAIWFALIGTGAVPCGTAAIEDLRILEGTPLYGVDFSDKHLPQEANLQRALNFTKGCYIGQEIVERIRSRATVHRSLRQFELHGEAPRLDPGETRELRLGATAAGELTSVAALDLPDLRKNLALGIARVEALEKSDLLEYDGGTATPLAAPPNL